MHASSRPLLALGVIGLLAAGPGVALADTGHGSSAPTTKGAQDPRGNNGTVKISDLPVDGSNRNQPHVGCSFALKFFGFDKDQTADITFTGQAPTKAGTLLKQSAVTISDDAAGGGKDADAVLTYTAQGLGLSAITPAKQGWHVKVAVDVLQAPGGAKQKVFWLSCPQSTPSTSGPGTAAPGTPAAPAAAAAAATVTTAGAAPTSGSSADVANSVTAGSGSVTLGTYEEGGTVSTSDLTAGTARALGGGRGASLGSGLPFTGFALGSALLAGLAAVGAGATALVLGTRRRTV